MSAETIQVRADLIAKDEASPAIRAATETLAAFERQVKSLGAVLGKGLGAELARSFESIASSAKALGSTMTEAGEKGTRAFASETTAARELSAALREVASAQDAIARASRGAAGGNRPPRGPSGSSGGNGRGRGRGAAGNDLRDVRARWRIREASERAERRDAERERVAQASAAAAQLKAESDAFNLKLRNSRFLMGVRERSEAAEQRHVAGVRREHESMRRRAASAGRHAYSHARHAVRSVNHPALESPGHAAALGAAFGLAAGHRIIESTVALDTAATRYRMLAVPAGVDPAIATAEARKQALKDSISLGVDADKLLDIQTKAIRDGVAPEIAKTLPATVVAAAQTMGGDVEKLTDSLAEGLQEAFAMKWLKTPEDTRKFLNIEAGLSNYAGNSAARTEQFIAAGGLGHGKEMGLNLVDTMAYGAMLNASGARTGQASARFMGQLSQNVPKMFDYYRSAVQSKKNTEEDRAVRAAPRALGYAGIRDMQAKIMAGPAGLIDYATRLDKLDEKTRKLVLQGFHFSEQGGAMLAELGANDGAKGKSIIARSEELSKQKAANDYLTEKFREWQTGLANMIAQIEKGWHAIETEIGDVLKVDLITPFRDWWVDLSRAIVGGNLRDRVHNALMGFVHGLGFEDVAALLRTLSSNVGSFDVAGFAQGLGEGVRAVVDSFRSMAGVFGGAGGLDARTVGRIAAEMFGLSVALHVVAPIVTTIGGIASAFLAVKAALSGAMWLSRLTGLSAGLSAIVGVDLAAGAAGLMSFAGALGVISAAVQALLSSGILPKVSLLPKDGTAEGLDTWLWGKKPDGSSARPAWVDRLTSGNAPVPAVPSGAPNPSAESPSDHWARKNRYMHPSSFDGDSASWRDLLTPAAYVTDSDDASAGDRDRDTAAMIGTSRAAQRIADSLATLVPKLGTVGSSSSLSGGGEAGGAGGGTMGSVNRYMRWAGHGAGDNLGNSSTPARGALAANQKEAFAAARAAGLNETAARALVANMSGESLASPGNYHWDRKHMSGGIVQWDPQRAAAIQRQFGKLPWQMSVSEQTKAAVWEIQNNPRFAATARALQGNDSGAMIGALVRNYESPANPGAAIMRRMGYFRGFNPNGAAGGGAGEAAGELHLASRVLGEQCVDLAKAAVGATGSVTTWRKGVGADVGSLVPGTPVATFLDRQGRETDRYAGGGTGTPGAHLDHAGIFRKYVLDGAGKRIGMQIAEQFAGSHGAHLKTYMFGQGYGEGNGSNYHAILGRDGKPLGGDRNPLAKTPTPASLAEGAKAGPKGSTPIPHQAPAPHKVTTADNSTVVHITNHIHGVTDPHHLVRMMSDASAARRRSSYAT